jgi:hypothetical protein
LTLSDLVAADVMHHLDQCHDILVGSIRQQAVAQVEDVAGAVSGLVKDTFGAPADKVLVAV